MEAPGRGLPCPAERGAYRCVQVRHADAHAHVARLGRRVTLYINITPVRARVLRDDRCIFPAVRRASEARGGKEEGLMELRHPLSGDMAVVKSAPRCKSSFNRCAGALPLVMSHAPSLHPTIGGNEVAPKSRLASTSPFTAAPSSRRGATARAWRIVCRPDPLFSPGGRPDATDRTPQNVHFLFAPAFFTPFNSAAVASAIRRLS